MPNPPAGYIEMDDAVRITGYHRVTITEAALAGEIPDAYQRIRKSPWRFTEAGLRKWMGIDSQVSA